jgi:hypothetical protein
MTEVSKKVLYWAPRVSCIAFALFLSLFAMDVFGEGLGFWRTLFALFMHLIPTFVVLLILALAWRWEWIGAAGFSGAALVFLFNMPRHLSPQGRQSAALTIAGPVFVIAALFLANWLKRKELHAGR